MGNTKRTDKGRKKKKREKLAVTNGNQKGQFVNIGNLRGEEKTIGEPEISTRPKKRYRNLIKKLGSETTKTRKEDRGKKKKSGDAAQLGDKKSGGNWEVPSKGWSEKLSSTKNVQIAKKGL